MRKKLSFILILCCVYIAGCCSIPRAAGLEQLYSITKGEKNIKRRFGGKTKVKFIRDFRDNEAYDENITNLKQKAEEYISRRGDLDESAKANLRELRVTAGATKEEVRLLLGVPDKAVKIRKKGYDADEMWIYNTYKPSVFTLLFFPVFFGHEKYYLYFNDNILTLIERRYLEQTLYSDDYGMGLQTGKK